MTGLPQEHSAGSRRGVHAPIATPLPARQQEPPAPVRGLLWGTLRLSRHWRREAHVLASPARLGQQAQLAPERPRGRSRRSCAIRLEAARTHPASGRVPAPPPRVLRAPPPAVVRDRRSARLPSPSPRRERPGRRPWPPARLQARLPDPWQDRHGTRREAAMARYRRGGRSTPAPRRPRGQRSVPPPWAWARASAPRRALHHRLGELRKIGERRHAGIPPSPNFSESRYDTLPCAFTLRATIATF